MAQSLPTGPDGHSLLASKGPGSKLPSTVGGWNISSFILFQFATRQRAITQLSEKKGCLCFLVLSERAHFHPCGYGRVLLTGQRPPPVVLWLSALLSWISVLVNHESLVSINLQQIPAAIFGVFTIESPGTKSKVSVCCGVITNLLHQRWRMDEWPCDRASLWLRSTFVCVFSKMFDCWLNWSASKSGSVILFQMLLVWIGASWRFLSAAVKREHRHI